MKKLILLLSLSLSFTAFAEVVATCKDAKIPVGENDNGTMVWGKGNIDITVNKTASKYTAAIKFGDEVLKVNKGIEVTNFNGTAELGEFIEIAKMAKFPVKKIAGGTYYNFHPEANRDDAAGVSLAVLADKNGAVVGKIFQAGWGVGVCK